MRKEKKERHESMGDVPNSKSNKSFSDVPPMPIMDKIGKTVKNKKHHHPTDTDTYGDIDDLPDDLANMLLDDSVNSVF